MNKDVGLELCCMEKFVSVVVPKERREVVFFFFEASPKNFLAKVRFRLLASREKLLRT